MTRQNSVMATRVPHVLASTVSDSENRRTVDSTTTINHNPARNYSGGNKGNMGTQNGLSDDENNRQNNSNDNGSSNTNFKKSDSNFKGPHFGGYPSGTPKQPPSYSYNRSGRVGFRYGL